MSKSFAQYPSLNGKSVFITGGASGIGAEIVKAFAEQKAKVGFVDLDEEGAEKLIEEIGNENVHFAKCDLREIDTLKNAFAELVTKIGDADVLINNAARDDRHDWKEVTVEYWDERQATNIRHQFFAIQSVAPAMIEKGKGAIVNIGSNSWWEKSGNMPAYTTAKSAVHGLTRTMARDLGDHRIRVNAIVPGWVMTERQKELWVTKEKLDFQLKKQCLPDPVEPVYIARMAVFLASDDSAMCSAGNFMVEGGSV